MTNKREKTKAGKIADELFKKFLKKYGRPR